MSRKNGAGFLGALLTGAILLSGPAARAQHAYGERSLSFEAFNGGMVFWAGWNGSFSETFSPVSETYNWILLFGPTGVFAALTSAESKYSSVDMYAALNGFVGMANVGESDVTWEYYSNLSGVTYSRSIDIVPNTLSVDFGFTFFRNKQSTMQRAFQFSAGSSFKLELGLSILDHVPSVAIDIRSDLTNQDTGFWPVLLWEIDAATDDPIAEVMAALREVALSQESSFVAIHQRRMAQSLLPAFASMEVSSGAVFSDNVAEVTMGDYVAEYLQNMNSSSHSPHTIGAAIDDVGDWFDSGDQDAPGRIMDDIPVSPTAVVGVLRTVRGGVHSGFEAAYRHGYDYAVSEGTRNDDTIYADCLVTHHCLMGDGCILEVTAEEIASLVTGSGAGDFEGAPVLFDAAPSEYLNSGEVGALMESAIENGVAEYGFVREEESSILIGARVPAARTPASNGMNLELCGREVVMFSLVEEENVTVVNGGLTKFTQYDPNTLPVADVPKNFTHGFYTFEITPDEPGGTVDIVIDLRTSLAPGYSWAKYNLADKEWIDWSSVALKKSGDVDGLTIDPSRHKVTITIADNGSYDDDDTLGLISESSGAALFDVAFEAVSASDYLTGDSGGTDSVPDGGASDETDSACSCRQVGTNGTKSSLWHVLFRGALK